MPRTLLGLVVTCSVLAVVQACSPPVPGTPATDSSAAPTRLAPGLSAPAIDVTAAKQDPCGLLTSTDQGELGLLGPGEANADDITGPSCAYVRRTPSDPVVVVGVNVQSGGLEGLYQRRANFQLFEPTALEGYPGLYLNPAGGPEICSLVVAVNAEELLFADAVPGGPGPAADGLACDQAEQVMTAIFDGLPRGS